MIIGLVFDAVKKLIRNKWCTILATIGIIVSTFVIFIIFTLSNVSKNVLISYLTYKYPVLNTLTCKVEGGNEYSMTTDEMYQIDNSKLDYVKDIVYQSDFSVECRISDNVAGQLYGAYKQPVSIKITEGRFLLKQESTSENCFNIVISDELKKNIFKDYENVLNSVIEIEMDNNCTYQMKIVGVYKSVNEYTDTQVVYGSFNTISRLSGRIKPYTISKFSVIVSNISKINNVKLSISSILNNRYQNSLEYKYNIMVCDVLESSKSLINLFSVLLILFSSIIFFVSAISIRNVILTIMQSYIHQIGIKKAIGASEKIICLEYLIQGIIIALAGSITGFVLFLLSINILNNNISEISIFIDEYYGMPFINQTNLKLYLTNMQFILAYSFAIVVVIICCYNPVRKMAAMKVVDAIKN